MFSSMAYSPGAAAREGSWLSVEGMRADRVPTQFSSIRPFLILGCQFDMLDNN